MIIKNWKYWEWRKETTIRGTYWWQILNYVTLLIISATIFSAVSDTNFLTMS